MRRTFEFAVAALALPLVLGGCAAEQEAAADDNAVVAAVAAPAELVVRASDFTFAMPDTVPAGATRVRLINDGPDFHHVFMIRLEDGHTVEELLAAMPQGEPEWATAVGGPNPPGMPGEEAVAIVDLKPGTYAVICVIPGPDGVPHVAKGMVKQLVVVAAEEPAPLPAAEYTMHLNDYSFGMSAPITAGRHTIRVQNDAAQPHEVAFVKLEPGKTPQDFVAFIMKPEGTPPGKLMGGSAPMSQGEANVVEVDFTPGTWGLLCFVPDAKDGKEHIAHGMIQQFEIE